MPTNEPPGAQILLNNPLFVRSHDFFGGNGEGGGQSWRLPHCIRERLCRRAAALTSQVRWRTCPLSWQNAEQDFIVPENVQP
jgi:hypothetical protein